jgi:hypothetical protein
MPPPHTPPFFFAAASRHAAFTLREEENVFCRVIDSSVNHTARSAYALNATRLPNVEGQPLR